MCMCANHACIYALHICVRINGMIFRPLERFRNTQPIPKMTWITIMYFLLHSYFFFIVIHTVISSDWLGNERSACTRLTGAAASKMRKHTNWYFILLSWRIFFFSWCMNAYIRLVFGEQDADQKYSVEKGCTRQSRRFVPFVWYVSLCRLLFMYFCCTQRDVVYSLLWCSSFE